MRLERTQVPFFPQTPHHCGPAALATALADVGLPSELQALSDAVFLPAREGSLQLEMLAGARRQGAVATVLPGQLTALLRELQAGHAVIVLQNLGLAVAPTWHYAVLVGYDLQSKEVLLRSGTTERQRLPLRTFEFTWARAGHWAVVVLPPGQLPAQASEEQALQATLGFERVAASGLSVQAYRGLLQRWPNNRLAGIGLANSLYATGQIEAAAQVFERVARQHNSAVAWHNLARIRLQQRQLTAAQEAALRALKSAEETEPAWLPAAKALHEQLRVLMSAS
jgi:tetratricopeptide (TPR) repeat protein